VNETRGVVIDNLLNFILFSRLNHMCFHCYVQTANWCTFIKGAYWVRV